MIFREQRNEFSARSADELSLAKGDRIELIERDDDFGDGWFLGKHLGNGNTGLFPESYTQPAPRPPTNSNLLHRPKPQTPAQPAPTSIETQTASQDRTAYPAPLTEQRSLSSQRPSEPSFPPSHVESYPTTAASATTPSYFAATPPVMSAGLRSSVASTAPRALSLTIAGSESSPVMNETLSVINEHITDMHTPRHSLIGGDRRGTNDSGSDYSSGNRLSRIPGHETDEEEQNLHTEEEVLTWTPARVAEYLEDVGVERKHCEVFLDQEISGEVLLAMDQSSIFLKEFDLGPVGRRLRTWHKIKALQTEVKSVPRGPPSMSDYSATEESINDAARNRSTSTSAVLPRIPSLMESSNARGSSRQSAQRNSSQPQAVHSEYAPPWSSISHPPGVEDPRRPSAASVRDLNHSRRHSSIDHAASQETPNSITGIPQSASPVRTSHTKHPSFDRNWTMGNILKPLINGRPTSSSHMYSLSSDDKRREPSTGEYGMSTVTPQELDRGYFSGPENDHRTTRNKLRKGSWDHSRKSSLTADNRRRSATLNMHSKVGSTESVRDSVASITSPAAQTYYGTNHRKSQRASSGPEFSKQMKVYKDLPPTVTKLDYNHSPSIDAVATSPNLAGSDTSSIGRASPSPALASQAFFAKKKAMGLRAISDAITGNEKAFATSPDAVALIPSPVKESPLQSPSRTGSSTPSATSKSIDLENPDAAKSADGSSGGLTPTLGAARRKSKKTTSAYTRGLQKKSPQEQMVGCDYSGWMKKRSSNLMTTWKTRLFVLRGRRLSYYYSEHDTEEKGLIDISSHRVLPANNERITGFHATLTGATSSPTSPHNTSLSTTAAADAAAAATAGTNVATGMFIFKLVPPRSGLSKAVNFTKPTVHYFAVENVHQGRLWMAALMKATIDRDETKEVITTYQQKTISLAKARAQHQRPPALMETDDEGKKGGEKSGGKGLGLLGMDDAKLDPGGTGVDGEKKEGSFDASSVALPGSGAGSFDGDGDRKTGVA
ncbi:hypothetical protein H2201_001464 [Coniosporium apollinis]|uniref:Polar growth protein n=1 Tax=Coniosporium apollinis TaxID=61459 RepID=A0ABQ9P1E3_9PEZI|nr:hypothetical protein H2201_001464 [Coniosporium apollinis]